jgi:hypothetical protein
MDLTKGSLSARKQWEEQQAQRYGCRYIDGVCQVHGGEQTASEPKPQCTCRSFARSHDLDEHDTLPRRFAGDTELRRFEDAAATDWRTAVERQLRRESARMFS